MHHFYVSLTSEDGSIESPDREGVTLEDVGHARALAVETLLDAAKDRPPYGAKRTLHVFVHDERMHQIYTDSVTVSGGPHPGSDDAAVGRAIGAMGRER